MKRRHHVQCRQLDLLALANRETLSQRFDAIVRKEIIDLLKLLLDESSTAETTEATDE